MNPLPDTVSDLVARQFIADHLPQFKAWLQAHGVCARQAEDRVRGLAMQTAATITAALPDEPVDQRPADQPEASAASTTPRTAPRIPL